MGVNWTETFIDSLKFLVSLFWGNSRVPSEFFFPIATDLWMMLCLYWLISALKMKAVKSRESSGRRLSYVLPMAVGIALIFSHRAHYSWLGARFAPDTTALAVIGVVATAAGVALAMWARYILGENWSAVVSIRQDHELIRIGPYRTMRHPIYTGMLLALLGTALVVGEVRALLGLVIVVLGFYRKARQEETLLSREFGVGFESHAKHTGMFLPKIFA
jgi:protein-S-isoprenylcysteine O-methyltransferase Ste14